MTTEVEDTAEGAHLPTGAVGEMREDRSVPVDPIAIKRSGGTAMSDDGHLCLIFDTEIGGVSFVFDDPEVARNMCIGIVTRMFQEGMLLADGTMTPTANIGAGETRVSSCS